MATGQNNNSGKRIAIDFIDPLFAVVISISFFEVMERSWFNPSSISDLSSFTFNMLTLLLGYFTVVLSWVGYHQSIRSRPIRIETLPGFWRFILDILLLFCYWILLVKFETFWFVLLTLVIIYWIFVIWDHLKWHEHKDNYSKEEKPTARRRRGVSTFWAIIITGIFVANWLLIGWCDYIWLTLAFIATILYRLHKTHLIPANILDLLAFSKPERKAHT